MAATLAPFERVYFIGAGLSAGLHYPTGGELMQRLVAYLKGKPENATLVAGGFTNTLYGPNGDPERARKLLEVIERVLDTYFATMVEAVDQVDVAEFFTMAQVLSESPWLIEGARTPGVGAPVGEPDGPSEATLFQDLALVTRTYFTDLSASYRVTPDIRSVLKGVRRRQDAIINFNWDEEVDIVLTEGDGDVSYTLGAWQTEVEEGATLMLKPHGSVGWYDIQRGIGNADTYLIAGADKNLRPDDKRIVAYFENDLPLQVDRKSQHPALACPPVITAPTFAKRFHYEEQHRIWRDVLTVCGTAHEFIFLGYSLPKDDYLTRAAIHAALRSGGDRQLRCLLVDRSMNPQKRLTFSDVFDGFSPRRNFLRWTFGSDDASLGALIQERLQQARVPRL